jgi:GAF domain-containing protein
MAKDEFAAEVAAEGDSDEIRAILDEVCRITDMGFAAVARVTDTRWIAAQINDKVEFGLDPGDELDIKTTICDEIRDSGQTIIIDDVSADPSWRTHPVPIIYGFKSYVSIPLYLGDGSFYGTLCAIDPVARTLTAPATVELLVGLADRTAALLSMAKAGAGVRRGGAGGPAAA